MSDTKVYDANLNCPYCKQNGFYVINDVQVTCSMCNGERIDRFWVHKRDAIKTLSIYLDEDKVKTLLDKAYAGHLEYRNSLSAIKYYKEVPEELYDALNLSTWWMKLLPRKKQRALDVAISLMVQALDIMEGLQDYEDDD